jgi:hypothetical protein
MECDERTMLGRVVFAVAGAIVLFGYLLWFTSSTLLEAAGGGVLFLAIGLAIAFGVGLRERQKR